MVLKGQQALFPFSTFASILFLFSPLCLSLRLSIPCGILFNLFIYFFFFKKKKKKKKKKK